MKTFRDRVCPILVAVAVIFLAGGCRQDGQPGTTLTLYSLESGQTLDDGKSLDALAKKRLILVGEHHTNVDHHSAQLNVIRFLHDNGRVFSIGLEMFRSNQQALLDQWLSGAIDESHFERIYLDNWNFPWPLYRDIFVYAREKQIPLIGLNVSREITRQVARDGFASLTADQRGELSGVTCNVTRAYRDFIRKALGAHGHGSMDFNRFCEAQLVWDTVMAVGAINDLKQHPDRSMVLLAGSGHARKLGIPYQVENREPLPVVVLLPFTADLFTPEMLTTTDADYIVMP